MSNTSSDTESSCGWSIISMEGSDIETLVADGTLQHGAEERPALVQPKLQDSQAACCDDSSLDDTLGEKTMDRAAWTSEADPDDPTMEEQVAVLSFSDHSDIVTLQELKEDERDCTEHTPTADEGSFMGTSCSSQYAFIAGDPVFPATPQPAAPNSSSSEDEAAPNVAIRRRRLRKNTTNTVTESCEEEEEETTVESEEEDETQQGQQIALSVGFGHLYCTMQIQKKQKTVDKFRERELDSLRNVLHYHVKSDSLSQEDWDEQKLISLLMQKNMEFSGQQEFVQVQREDQAMLARQREAESLALTTTNQQLKSSLEQKEKSLSTLQEELRSLQSRIRDLEVKGAAADALLLDNRRLNEELEGEKELRKKLDKERKLTHDADKERMLTYETEAQDLRLQLRELEKRLGFEQQRSDLWERLYLETKEDRAKGDTEPNMRTSGIVEDTFDAVKNSTKEFVHHHKEQIKKAKEVVKENLRKFSDSVKSTFRNFKDSASTFFEKMTREGSKYYEEKKYKKKKAHSKQDANTRKPGDRVHKEQGQSGPKGCRGVFDCAYQESMSIFNKATEPIRADEFHQLLWSYLQREVHHFHHWKELESFINGFFHNGLFIHDRMLFTDFVSSVEHYLVSMPEYHGLHNDVFEDVDDFIYRHLFGEAYVKSNRQSFESPSGPLERPDSNSKEESRTKNRGRRQQRQKARHHSEQRSRHMADVKIELGPMPLDRKY
ncbi:cell cycle progression protein 1 isoform X2 [Syngnathus typhle]|uniref:cell cycle progression protein 1 isoform X2 n=1 Tax=Syngnathus typhle TaxID=161592 RepID=UPI002A6AB761|nr:cell cycle progression protein 1 isoform X2 [Syngnathus typhle]